MVSITVFTVEFDGAPDKFIGSVDIVSNSEVVKDVTDTITYVKDTDYEINYPDGRINRLGEGIGQFDTVHVSCTILSRDSWTVSGTTYDDGSNIDYGEDAGSILKIFRYAPRYAGSRKVPPYDLNYDTELTRRLFKKNTFFQGELRKVEYMADSVEGSDSWPTYSDIILKEDIVYVRDSIGFAKSRDTTISWYQENGALNSETKLLHKVYSPIESQQEGITRRSNIIDQLALTVGGLLLAVLPTNGTYPDAQAKLEVGRVFIQTHKTALDMFVQVSKRDIVAIVKYATEPWLATVINQYGTTIRDVIISEVDIWGIVGSV